ncbi:MAG: RNA methyltransferase [Armatimonadetes bacterium]|nr:MAG: RNA methyltransferase [Armatimonadota bacterium]
MARVGIGTDLEGYHAVRAAVAAGRVTALAVESGRMRRPEIAEIVDQARAAGARVEVVDDVRDRAVTGAPQGIVATARPLPTVSIKEMVAAEGTPALLVVDHIEDPRNIGAAARSALASGMSGLVVSHNRSAPLGATAFKAAVGALEVLPVASVSSIPDALKRLSQLGVWCVGLDGIADRSLLGLDLLALPVAVCVGAEGSGLSKLVAERCDVIARIPMVGDAESLNASVASAIACYEVARVRGWVS